MEKKYCLSTNLLLLPDARGGLEAVNRTDGSYVRLGRMLSEVIGHMIEKGEFSKKIFISITEEKLENQSESLFSALLFAGIITEVNKEIDDPHEPLGKVEYPWEDLGWGAARFFHEGVVHSSFAQGDQEGMLEQSRHNHTMGKPNNIPPVVKKYPGACRISLCEPEMPEDVDFFRVLTRRRTCRNFHDNQQISNVELSTILHLTARAHGIIKKGPLAPSLRKTCPSGGARHPVEIYPIVFSSTDIPCGAYYYDSRAHELITVGDFSSHDFYNIGQKQSGCVNMPVGFILTTRYPRNLWKYRYPKSYLFTWLDVGHFAQNLVLTSEALGFKSFLTPALNVKKSLQLLELANIFDECPVYLLSLGKR